MATPIDRNAKGVYPISVTPFLDDGAIDLESMDRLTDFFVSCQVPGITLLGVLGEANKLSSSESMALLQRVLKRAADRLQVIVGVSHIGLDNFADFTRQVMDAGASGIMVTPASGLKTEDQVLNYFEGLMGRIGPVPMALQDYPQNSGVFMSVDTVGKLLTRHDNIKILKHEEGSALRKISKLRQQESSGQRERVSVLVGNSGIHLPQELHRGVDGANTGVAYPEMLIEVCRRFFAGQAQEGEDLYDIFLPLVRHEQQPGIGLAIRKEIFRRRGLIASAKVRAPGPVMDADDHLELSRLLNRLLRRLDAAGQAGLIQSHQVAVANVSA
jgi:4-hydroxy-tetrahydrodipicolinate synthase